MLCDYIGFESDEIAWLGQLLAVAENNVLVRIANGGVRCLISWWRCMQNKRICHAQKGSWIDRDPVRVR